MIRITEDNRDKIDAAISEAEGRSSARLADHWSAMAAVEMAEHHQALSSLPKKMWTGAKATLIYGERFPNAYSGTPYCTAVNIVRRATGWFYAGAYRTVCPSSTQLNLYLTEEQSAEVLLRFSDTYTVIE